jgi:hypothetical protein
MFARFEKNQTFPMHLLLQPNPARTFLMLALLALQGVASFRPVQTYKLSQ